MRMIVIIRTLIVFVAVVGIIIAGKFLYQKSISENTLPYFSTVPDFEFVTGDSIPFGLNELKGKISVVDFIFTRCKGPCPIMANLMGTLYHQFNKKQNVQFVSISVDPEFDSLHVLREYAQKQGVDDKRWVFLSAPMEDIANLCEGGFKLSADELPGAHPIKFILVDRNGMIRGYYNGTEEKSVLKLQQDIKRLL